VSVDVSAPTSYDSAVEPEGLSIFHVNIGDMAFISNFIIIASRSCRIYPKKTGNHLTLSSY